MGDCVRATRSIGASAEAIFAIIAEPTHHASIDGTGWVLDAQDHQPLTTVGQIFRVSMYHPNHPDGKYEMANVVLVFDPPWSISWKPGYETGDGTLGFGGWTWRYDLEPPGQERTQVTLTYDWSAVAEDVRRRIGFPPFPTDHLDNSLTHLDQLVTAPRRPRPNTATG